MSSTGASTSTLEMKPTLTLDDGADLIFTRARQAQGARGRHHRRHRGDHDRRAPPALDGQRRQAAVPGDRGQRQRDQVGLRQRLRHRPVVAGRHPARDRRCCWPARPSWSPATATAAAASPSRAAGMGANVIVTEIKPTAALKAIARRLPRHDDGRRRQARRHLHHRDRHEGRHRRPPLRRDEGRRAGLQHRPLRLRDQPGRSRGALARASARSRRQSRSTCSRTAAAIYVLAQGRLVNLAAAEGHPSRGDGHVVREPVPGAVQARAGTASR